MTKFDAKDRPFFSEIIMELEYSRNPSYVYKNYSFIQAGIEKLIFNGNGHGHRKTLSNVVTHRNIKN